MSVEKEDKPKSSSNEELITRKNIEDSPFQVIGLEGEYFGCMGKYRITETAETELEIVEELEKVTWNRLVQVMLLLIESTKEI